MSEPQFDIDKAEEQYDQARADTPDPALDPDKIEVEEVEDNGNPPGFLSFEEYVDQGGDPDMYRGKKAFVNEHDRIQENKRLRKEIRGLNTTVQQTMDAVSSWKDTERKKMRTELTQDLHKAREDEDVDGAIAAQKALDEHDSAESAEPKPQQVEVPVIADFRIANPLLDQESEQFNSEFNEDVERLYNITYDRLTMDRTKALNDGQIKRCLNKAVKEARELHPDLFESPRNKRAAPGEVRSQRRTRAQESAPKAENYVVNNPRNPTQKNAAVDIRETIRKAAHKQALKTGKSPADAEKAADKAATDFERSLHK